MRRDQHFGVLACAKKPTFFGFWLVRRDQHFGVLACAKRQAFLGFGLCEETNIFWFWLVRRDDHFWILSSVSVSGTCRIPKRLLYTVRDRERRFYGLYSCREVLNASTESAHTTVSCSWFQWTIVSTKNECLVCSVLQSVTLRPFEFFIKRLSMMFVVSQSLYTLALMFLLGLAVVNHLIQQDQAETVSSFF